MIWSPIARVRRFAQRVQQRHLHAVLRRTAVARVLARAARPAHGVRHLSLHLRAHFELARRSAGIRRDGLARPWRPAEPRATRVRAVRYAATRAMAARFSARGARQEQLGAPLRDAGAGLPDRRVLSATIPTAIPVPRVLRRDRSRNDATETADAYTTRLRSPSRVISQSNPATLAPSDVDRLADHVLQTINRRLHAFRERRGRV